jgi:hypothetical protein
MSGAIPPLPNTPPWRGAHLKHRDNFTFIECDMYLKHSVLPLALRTDLFILSFFATTKGYLATRPQLSANALSSTLYHWTAAHT